MKRYFINFYFKFIFVFFLSCSYSKAPSQNCSFCNDARGHVSLYLCTPLFLLLFLYESIALTAVASKASSGLIKDVTFASQFTESALKYSAISGFSLLCPLMHKE